MDVRLPLNKGAYVQSQRKRKVGAEQGEIFGPLFSKSFKMGSVIL